MTGHYAAPVWHLINAKPDEHLKDLDFVLRRGCILHGRLLDKATGAVLSGIELVASFEEARLTSEDGLRGFGKSDDHFADSDSGGRFRIEGLQPEPYEIYGYVPREKGKKRIQISTLEVPKGVFLLERDFYVDAPEIVKGSAGL